MGNSSSNQQKLLHTRENEPIQRTSRFDSEYRYGHENKIRNKRSFSFYYKNGKSKAVKSKSQSLDAIIEELYFSGDDNYIYDEELAFKLKNKPSLIPKIKLTRSVSSLRDEKRYQQLFNMTTNSNLMQTNDLEKSSRSSYLRNEEDGQNSETLKISDQINENNAVVKKPDEYYFTKNFDECMKRLQLIEKQHEMIEKNDSEIQLYFLQEQSEDKQNEVLNENSFISSDIKKFIPPIEINNCNKEKTEITLENQKFCQNFTKNSEVEDFNESDMDASNYIKNKELISAWYSNLKEQFEKPQHAVDDQKNKEMSCRITGATLKNSNEIQKLENAEKDTRHYFSRLVKSNKSLIDEELPDPDKVKNIRAMFQENLNSTLKKLDKKLGGSMQNISIKTLNQNEIRPQSAQCNREDFQKEVEENKIKEDKENKISEMTEPKGETEKDFPNEISKRKLIEKYEKDIKPGKDFKGKKYLQTKWTDTGSVSSGVSSDLSSFDTDLEYYSRESTEQEQDDLTISDDDLLEEGKDKHFVQNEVLEKIRSFGTSVTYYGGEMITCSVGPLLSPTTQAIIEEIEGKYKQEPRATRSFDEFYRKYAETMEPVKKKKLGRTKSFGNNDVFQKPLSNTEIEMYKNDLEIEIGIKKPAGIPQNVTKISLAKSNSSESESETAGKICQLPKITFEMVNESDTVEETEDEISENTVAKENNSVKTFELNNNFEKKIDCNNIKESEINTEILSLENENKESLAESHNTRFERKKENFFRSKSVPEEFSYENKFYESESKTEESNPKEILFSYEKSLINGKRNSDMEFEEFEVCETVTDKLNKLEELNSLEFKGSDLNTIKENKKIEKTKQKEVEMQIKDKVINNTPPNKSLESLSINNESENFNTSLSKAEKSKFTSFSKSNDTNFYQLQKLPTFNYQINSKYGKHNYSRWPIETTVMVDIQKNNEQTPKLIKNGKTNAKTKIRLF